MTPLDQAAPLYRGRLRRGLAFLLPACVLALVALETTGVESVTQAGPRIVVVGDIHGAGTNLAQILQAAGLIDAQRKWRGGAARLVQTGDILDRGPEVREAIELLMRLEGEARRAGGRVDVLFGNH
jgi:calcineurin-like phosphoesterase family protein